MIPFVQAKTISLGPIPIQVWGLFVALGILVSVFILWKRAKDFDTSREELLDLVLYMLVSGLIFARIFHIVFYEFSFYSTYPVEIFKIWSGGLSSFGGFFGAILGFYWYFRFSISIGEIWKEKKQNKNWLKKIYLQIKNRKIKQERTKILRIADQLSFAAVFGWIIGRLGCASIHDHIGKLSNSFLAVNFPGGARFDMAIIEIIFLLPLAIIFFIIRKKKVFPGFYLAVILVYYGVLRFILDFFRATDIMHADTRYAGLTPGQYFGIVMVGVGLILFRGVYKRR